MSDVNMGKIKELYVDMVSIEKNVTAIEKRMIGNLAVLERRTAQHSAAVSRSKRPSPATSLKTLLMAASTAFGAGLALTVNPGFGSLWIAGIPIGIAITWLVVHCAEKNGRGVLETVRNEVSEAKRSWTETEFNNAAAATLSKLSDRTLEACRAVLVHGDDVESSALKNRMLPTQVRRAIRLLEEHKPSIRN
jgi:hypothetical protein